MAASDGEPGVGGICEVEVADDEADCFAWPEAAEAHHQDHASGDLTPPPVIDAGLGEGEDLFGRQDQVGVGRPHRSGGRHRSVAEPDGVPWVGGEVAFDEGPVPALAEVGGHRLIVPADTVRPGWR